MPLEHPEFASGCVQTIVVATWFWARWWNLVLEEVLSPYQTLPRKIGRHFLSLHLHLTEVPTEHPLWLLPRRQNQDEATSIPETPKFDPECGGAPPDEPAVGIATRVDAKDGSTQTPPLLSRLIQGHLGGTGMEACPRHRVGLGVRDPNCDRCKRALGPLYKQKIKGSGHLPVFTFDFSGPHPRRVNAAHVEF